MENKKLIVKISLFKAIIVAYFIDLVFKSINALNGFWGDDSEFGFWAWVSFFMISGFILLIDITIIILSHKIFKEANKRVYIYIFIIEVIICLIVYLGLEYTFKFAAKWNEYAVNVQQSKLPLKLYVLYHSIL